MPKQSLDTWAWRDALFFARKGEPDRLSELLRDTAKQVPDNVRVFLSDVLCGADKLPARNTRIKLDYRARLRIQKGAYAVGQFAAFHGKARVKAAKAQEIAALARETGAEPAVILKMWNRHQRSSFASWKRTKAIIEAGKRGYTSTIVRDGKKVAESDS